MEKKLGIGSGIRNSRREEINLANFSLTTSGYLSPGQLLPLVLQPSLPGVNLVSVAMAEVVSQKDLQESFP